MNAHLNLVKTSRVQEEKRSFPRFPLPTMTFKSLNPDMVFQVINFSSTGMFIQLKSGTHSFSEQSPISGSICWKGAKAKVNARVVWCSKQGMGLHFKHPPNLETFLHPKNIIKGLKALHLSPFYEQRPSQLTCWLQASLILNIFVWIEHHDQFCKFQTLFMENLVEWQEGIGLKTGKLHEDQQWKNPPTERNQFMVKLDQNIDRLKISQICEIIENIPSDKIQESAREFILMKLKAA